MRWLLIFLLLNFVGLELQALGDKPIVYLIPGQGADYRVFNNLKLDEEYEVRHIRYELPEKKMSLTEYAEQLSAQIDTCSRFILIGTSLGGMLAVEMSDFLNPEKVIIIASAKTRKELPGRYRFQKKLPIYKIVSGKMAKWGAQVLQPIVEYDRNQEKETFVQMLKDKDPQFLKRTIAMVMKWEREEYWEGVIHIHGEKDHTIPIKNVDCDYVIKDGSHLMTLTRGEEISNLINALLKDS